MKKNAIRQARERTGLGPIDAGRKFQKALAAKLTPADRVVVEHELTVIAGACLDLLEDDSSAR
jgi:hypothetical protein